MRATVIDTCCLINLYASQRPHALIRAVFDEAIIPKQVLGESLFIRQPGDDDPDRLVPVAINLATLVADEAVKAVGLDREGELERFVQLAELLADGEAACLAIASSRGLSLATDDRKAIVVASDLNVEVMTTPQLLMNWIAAVSPERREIAEMIGNIERYGRFKPHHTSPHAKWWNDNGPRGRGNP